MRQIAKRTAMTYQGARKMMGALSTLFPITEIDGVWQWTRESTTVASSKIQPLNHEINTP